MSAMVEEIFLRGIFGVFIIMAVSDDTTLRFSIKNVTRGPVGVFYSSFSNKGLNLALN